MEQTLSIVSITTGIAVMILPALYRMPYLPGAVSLVLCGAALVWLGRWIAWR